MQVLQGLLGRVEGGKHIVFKSVVAVAVEAADTGVAVGKARTRELFPDAHDFFTRVERVHERGRTAQILEGRRDAHEVVVDTAELIHDDAEHLRAFRDLHAEHVFHGAAVRDIVHDGRAVVEAVGIRDHLLPSAAFHHLLEPAVQVSDLFHARDDGLAVHGGHKAQAAVSRRMARTHVQGHQVQPFAILIQYNHSLILPSKNSLSFVSTSLLRWITL